jgi:hypothetical protein
MLSVVMAGLLAAPGYPAGAQAAVEALAGGAGRAASDEG